MSVLERLTAHLEAQGEVAATTSMILLGDCKLELERLETALNEIRCLPVDVETDSLPGYAGAVRVKAWNALTHGKAALNKEQT